MEKLLTILNFIKKYRDVLYIILLIIGGLIISSQCTKMDKLGNELDRQENNRIALVEELNNYKDALGKANAEKHAYQLTQEELRDSIGLLKKKNYEYLSYINSNIGIKDTVKIETIITRDVYVDGDGDGGEIKFEKNDVFGKSKRDINVTIPYNVKDNKLYTDDVVFTMNQNIFVEGWLERNNKTKETFIHLRSDYPNLTFNSGTGIVAESGKSYERSMRKNCGVGLAVGPNIGIGYDLGNKKFVPTVGIGLTIGFTFTPKAFQW